MKKYIFSLSFFVVVFSGCGSKQYYEPKSTVKYDKPIYFMEKSIQSYNNNGATLDDRRYITKKNAETANRFIVSRSSKFIIKNLESAT